MEMMMVIDDVVTGQSYRVTKDTYMGLADEFCRKLEESDREIEAGDWDFEIRFEFENWLCNHLAKQV